MSPAQREARKRAWGAEFSERTRTWRRRLFSVNTLLDGLGYGVLASAFGLAACLWLPRLLDYYHLVIPPNLPQGMVSGVITGAVVVIALAAAFWRPAQRTRLLP